MRSFAHTLSDTITCIQRMKRQGAMKVVSRLEDTSMMPCARSRDASAMVLDKEDGQNPRCWNDKDNNQEKKMRDPPLANSFHSVNAKV